ncbi:hypothetical protein SBI63_02670, partial [Mycolicibacterium sp. 120270]|nr:hypothetical protein [Mycolicibacterium sp. 120270]
MKINLTHSQAVNRLHDIRDELDSLRSGKMDADDEDRFRSLAEEFDAVNERRIRLEEREELARLGRDGGNGLRVIPGTERGDHGDDDDISPAARAVRAAAHQRGGDWGTRAAAAFAALHTSTRAVTAGSLDLPSLVQPDVVAKPRPGRLIDLLVTRQQVAGNSFEYYRQTVRTNNAAPVADGTLKPTSVFTVEPVEDRCRVIAHGQVQGRGVRRRRVILRGDGSGGQCRGGGLLFG